MNENLVKAAKLIAELAELAENDESVNDFVVSSWGITKDDGKDKNKDKNKDKDKTEPTSDELNEILSLMGMDN